MESVILGKKGECAHFVRNIAAKRERRRRKAFVIFAHPLGIVFQITTQIRSPLDWDDFWTKGLENVILHSVRLDLRYDI